MKRIYRCTDTLFCISLISRPLRKREKHETALLSGFFIGETGYQNVFEDNRVVRIS